MARHKFSSGWKCYHEDVITIRPGGVFVTRCHEWAVRTIRRIFGFFSSWTGRHMQHRQCRKQHFRDCFHQTTVGFVFRVLPPRTIDKQPMHIGTCGTASNTKHKTPNKHKKDEPKKNKPSERLHTLPQHPQPSTTDHLPSSGPFLPNAFKCSCSVTVVTYSMSSNAHCSERWARATSCFIDVKNPCGLKKPVIQKEEGRFRCNHVRFCESRSNKMVNHNPNVGEIQENSSPPGVIAHVMGTLAS